MNWRLVYGLGFFLIGAGTYWIHPGLWLISMGAGCVGMAYELKGRI